MHLSRIAPICVLACVACIASNASGQTYPITEDVYIDSGAPTTNLGNNNRQKAVSNAGSTQFPTPSLVHGLLKFPANLWTDIGTQIVASAVLHYTPFNNSLHGRGVELHPLLHTFVVGTGAAGSGATWQTFDGATAWPISGTGGDYDLTNFVLATFTPTDFSWDITALINNPTTQAELHSFGALLKVTNETTFVGNDFVSMLSHNNASGIAYVEISLIPPPTCPTPRFDADQDGDVDMDDFGAFQRCFTGSTGSVAQDCTCFDANHDNLINLTDFNAFKLCYSGAGVPDDPHCAD